MKYPLLFILFLAMASTGYRPTEVASAKELEKLKGTWEVLALEVEGMKVPEPAFKGSRIIINGETFKAITEGVTYEGTLKIKTTSKPKTIDLMFTEGPEKGKTALGIYELVGDDLKICLAMPGRTRPASFSTKPGSGHALQALRRQK
jgi:uncharacterized protein (TIGR03067 family)